MSPRRPGAAVRLLLAQLGILAAGLLVAAGASGVIGPRVFHDRLADDHLAPAVAARAEDAFHAANWIDVAILTVLTVLLAGTATVVLNRRINRAVAALAGAADDLAGGNYRARIPVPTFTPETDRIAGAFNDMAAQLRTVEATRRRLLDDLAHELRTPVATLDGYLEGIEDGVVQPSPQTLTLLRGQTARLTRLIGDLAAVSAAEEGRLVRDVRREPPGQLVADAAAAARAVAARDHPDKDLRVAVEAAADLPDVLVDRERIDQALANLLTNALRHSHCGGTVTVRARRAGAAVEIAVADTGDGIAAEHLPHLFERFYRADTARDRASGGSGIGLTIARAVVRAHGGTLSADSPGPGQGATMTIRLPAAVT